MTIDITALQTLPEVIPTPTGLRPPHCTDGTSVICSRPTCVLSKIVI
jgi:hypothetical protein